MHDQSRRKLLKESGALLVGVVGGLAVSQAAQAQQPAGHAAGPKGVAAVTVDAKATKICATCVFWGGTRRVTEDKKSVMCESLGWCNNPASHNYQRTTTPISGPMDAWKKWEAV